MTTEHDVVRRAPLTWSQEVIWLEHELAPPASRGYLNSYLEFHLPDTVSRERILQALADVSRENETFRTKFGWLPRGPVCQVVERFTPSNIHIIDAGLSPVTDLDQFRNELVLEPFDIYRAPPVRTGIARVASGGHLVILVAHHILVDGFSGFLLEEEFRERLRDENKNASFKSSVGKLHPCDLAAAESSAEGIRLKSKALGHYAQIFTAAPPKMFVSTPAGDSHSWQIKIESPRMGEAAAWIAERHRTTESTVYLTAFALLLSASSGLETCALTMDVANRFDNVRQRVVGTTFIPVPLVIDFSGDPDMTEMLSRAGDASFQAQKHSKVPYAELRELQHQKAVERGVHFRFGVNFNYVSGNPDRDSSSSDSETRVTWLPDDTMMDLDLWCFVDGGRDEAIIWASSKVFRQEDVLNLVYGLERIILRAAADDRMTRDEARIASGLAGPEADVDRHICEGSWVSLSELSAAIEAHADVDNCRVFVSRVQGGVGSVISAEVTTARTDLSIDELQVHTLRELAACGSGAVPRVYTIHAKQPTYTGIGTMHIPPGTVSGIGDSLRESGSSSMLPSLRSGEAALRAQLAEMLDNEDIDTAKSYICTGGKISHIPALIDSLSQFGHAGLTFQDFLSVEPLRDLGSRLGLAAGHR